jgi:hypothetical protein
MDEANHETGSAPAVVRDESSVGRVLVRCAICEQDRALVRSHEAADRVLSAHLLDCPGAVARGQR